MAEPSKRDAALMLDMILSAQDAIGFVSGMSETHFLVSRLHLSAVIRAPEIIGEAAGKVSAELQTADPEIPWRDIIAMRHRLIHGYADVRLGDVWFVLTSELAPLIAALQPLIPPPR
jgi:uncharacterized protein with HEPN domain